jgi:hypothetical protein
MIHCVIAANAQYEGEIVSKALQRSFSKLQVHCALTQWPDPAEVEVLAIVGLLDDSARYIREICRRPAKIIIFGKLQPAVAELAGVRLGGIERLSEAEVKCPPAPAHGMSESCAFVRYDESGIGAVSPLHERRLCRFDYTDEWNNLAYGRMECTEGPWAITTPADVVSAKTVGALVDGSERIRGAVATLRDFEAAAILWFARPVGPVDGPDWRIVEAFLSDYRGDELPCQPHLRDVPHGVAAAVTMRLDCDEDIASARALFELYQARGLPLSLAVTTDQADQEDHVQLLRDVRSASGSILSHSLTHRADWGGSADSAETESRQSKAWLEARVPSLRVRYAVSPFHRNSSFVANALAQAGYEGVVSGTISADPEYLIARGGEVPFGPTGFVSHSQSCMLHGDCLLSKGDPIRVYKNAFRIAQAGSQFFGFLDHPFSTRYSYGWTSEAARVAVHAEFLDFMERVCATDERPLLFVSEDTCLDFFRDKANTDLECDIGRGVYRISRTHAAGLPLSIAWRGRVEAAQ